MQLHYTHPSRLARRESHLKYLVLIAVVLLIAGCIGLSVQSHITKAQGETTSIVQHADGIDTASDTIEGNEGQKTANRMHLICLNQASDETTSSFQRLLRTLPKQV